MVKIKLSGKEIKYLNDFVKRGRKSARKMTRARVLLLINQKESDTDIAKTFNIGRSTVWRIKKRYREEGLQSALTDKPRPGQPKKYTAKHEAEIIATACTESPPGSKRWSLQLLTLELRKKNGLETINHETIRLILKKAKQNPG